MADLIQFKFSVNIDGLERSFNALAESLEDEGVKTALLRTGGHIQSRARKIIRAEGPGWDALDPATLKRKMTSAQVSLLAVRGRGKTGERSVVQKVVRDAAGADKWNAKAAVLNSAIERARSAGKKTKGLESRHAKAITQAKNRLANIHDLRHLATAAGVSDLIKFARKEVARSKAHGGVLRGFKALKKAGYTFSAEEQRKMLRQKKRRYNAREESTRILGSLYDTIGMHVDSGRLKVYSKAYISGIHNDGGTAGHGANIPKREFMKLVAADLDLFVEILNEEAIEAWEEA